MEARGSDSEIKKKETEWSEAWGVCGKVIGKRYDDFHSAQA